MRSPLVGTMLVLSLLALAACGVAMMCLDYLMHYSLLAISFPTETFAAITVFIALFLLVRSTVGPEPAVQRPRLPLTGPPPEQPLWQPLALAFSDGILNPKAF